MKSQVKLALNHSVCIDNVDMTKIFLIFFGKGHLSEANLETQNWPISWFFSPDFEFKFQHYPTFWANSRPGKVNDKIPGFQGFPGRVGTPFWLHVSQIDTRWCIVSLMILHMKSGEHRIRIRNIVFDHNTCTVYYESYSFIKYRGQGWLLLRPIKGRYHKSHLHFYKWIRYIV